MARSTGPFYELQPCSEEPASEDWQMVYEERNLFSLEEREKIALAVRQAWLWENNPIFHYHP